MCPGDGATRGCRTKRKATRPVSLVVHGDVLLRHVLAEYLRACGLKVVEAATTDEAGSVLARLTVDAVLGDASAPGGRRASESAALAARRGHAPPLHIATSIETAAQAVAGLCRDGQPGPDPTP